MDLNKDLHPATGFYLTATKAAWRPVDDACWLSFPCSHQDLIVFQLTVLPLHFQETGGKNTWTSNRADSNNTEQLWRPRRFQAQPPCIEDDCWIPIRAPPLCIYLSPPVSCLLLAVTFPGPVFLRQGSPSRRLLGCSACTRGLGSCRSDPPSPCEPQEAWSSNLFLTATGAEAASCIPHVFFDGCLRTCGNSCQCRSVTCARALCAHLYNSRHMKTSAHLQVLSISALHCAATPSKKKPEHR